MTPALQKMVEAMGDEIERQSNRMYEPHPGALDLEKVARAGLEAIRDIQPSEWIAEGSAWAAPGRLIAEILDGSNA